MNTPSVVLLTTKEYPQPIPEDIQLKKDLESQGASVEIQAWEELQDDGQDLFLIRTTWNYTRRRNEFLEALGTVRDRLWNPLPLIEWNSDKRYLLQLQEAGVPIVPTKIVTSHEELMQCLRELGGDEFIVKPVVGASAEGLVKFTRGQIPEVSSEVMLQPFQPEVLAGEVSMIFFAGEFSYATRKIPKPGDIRVQEEFGSTIKEYNPTEADFKVAKRALAQIPTDWLCARVDVLPGVGLMELELIEPSLYLSNVQKASGLVASQLVSWLQARRQT